MCSICNKSFFPGVKCVRSALWTQEDLAFFHFLRLKEDAGGGSTFCCTARAVKEKEFPHEWGKRKTHRVTVSVGGCSWKSSKHASNGSLRLLTTFFDNADNTDCLLLVVCILQHNTFLECRFTRCYARIHCIYVTKNPLLSCSSWTKDQCSISCHLPHRLRSLLSARGDSIPLRCQNMTPSIKNHNVLFWGELHIRERGLLVAIEINV